MVGQVWGKRGGDFFLLDQVRDRMDFPATVKAVRAQAAKWPRATGKLVEDKANGTAVIASLKRDSPGLIPVEPHGGKVVRANAVSPFVEAGNVFLPRPAMRRGSGISSRSAPPSPTAGTTTRWTP